MPFHGFLKMGNKVYLYFIKLLDFLHIINNLRISMTFSGEITTCPKWCSTFIPKNDCRFFKNIEYCCFRDWNICPSFKSFSSIVTASDAKGLSSPAEVELLREKVYATLEAYTKQKYPEQPGR